MSKETIQNIATEIAVPLDDTASDNALFIFMNEETFEFPIANKNFSERKFYQLYRELKRRFGKIHMWTKTDLTIRNGVEI